MAWLLLLLETETAVRIVGKSMRSKHQGKVLQGMTVKIGIRAFTEREEQCKEDSPELIQILVTLSSEKKIPYLIDLIHQSRFIHKTNGKLVTQFKDIGTLIGLNHQEYIFIKLPNLAEVDQLIIQSYLELPEHIGFLIVAQQLTIEHLENEITNLLIEVLFTREGKDALTDPTHHQRFLLLDFVENLVQQFRDIPHFLQPIVEMQIVYLALPGFFDDIILIRTPLLQRA